MTKEEFHYKHLKIKQMFKLLIIIGKKHESCNKAMAKIKKIDVSIKKTSDPRKLIKRYREKRKEIQVIFIYLKKACDLYHKHWFGAQ